MRRELMDMLACPLCKGELELEVDKEDGAEVLDGRLECGRCKVSYPIEEGIPNMLPPDGK